MQNIVNDVLSYLAVSESIYSKKCLYPWMLHAVLHTCRTCHPKNTWYISIDNVHLKCNKIIQNLRFWSVIKISVMSMNGNFSVHRQPIENPSSSKVWVA